MRTVARVVTWLSLWLSLGLVIACGGKSDFGDDDGFDSDASAGSPARGAQPQDGGKIGPNGDAAPPEDARPPAPDATSGGDDASDDAFAPATHTPLPQIPTAGGPELTHVHLVTVTYAGFAMDSAVQAFGDYVVASPWLAQVGADYGVGAGTHTHVEVTDTAPATMGQADYESFLTSKIADGTLPGPLTTSPNQYLYMLFIPPGTTISDLAPGMGCASNSNQGSAAWHQEVDTVEAKYAYAIIPICSATPVAQMEIAASHELIEAATDTYVYVTPAYMQSMASPWASTAEVADMCEFFAPVAAGTHTFTSVWSNSAAASGAAPCVPAAPGPYFNVAPAGPDVTRMVIPGQTLTFDLVGWSTAPVADWTLDVGGANYTTGGPTTTLSSATINNGTHVTLTVGVPANAPPNSNYTIGLCSVASATATYCEAVWYLSLETGGSTGTLDGGGVDAATSAGSLLVGGNLLYPLGATSDGYAVYTLGGGGIYAIPLTGGTPSLVTPGFDQEGTTVVSGTSVALWSPPSATGAAQLEYWTSASGLHVLSQSSTIGLFAVSGDGTKILYSDAADGTTADLMVANVDGSDPVVVAAGTLSRCLAAAFDGDAIVAQLCPASDAGATATIATFAGSAYAEDIVATGLAPTPSLVLDSAGAHAFVASAAGAAAGSVITLATKAAAPVADGVTPWYLSPDAGTVLYANASGALVESPVATPSAVTLAASGAGGLLGVAADQSAVAYYSTASYPTTDLYLASAAAGQPPATLATQGAIYQGFASDPSAVVYLASFDSSTYLGTLEATTVAGATTQLGTNAASGFVAPGGRVVGLDDVNLTSYLASVHVTDLAKGTPAALAAYGATGVVLDATGTRAIYGAYFPAPGLYVMSLP